MIKSVISFILAALLLPGMPSVSWKAQVNPVQDNQYQVVVTGTIAPDYYVHPMGDPFVGTLLSVEEGEGVTLVGTPVEEYTPSEYKGEEVVTGTYVIRQDVSLASSATVKGTVTWSACSGDQCNMPEDYEFALPVEVAGSSASSASASSSSAGGLWSLILEAILWGFLMLLTPCVFPMVPMTVSFFIKQSGSAARGRFNAFMYGLFIVLLYTLPICLIIGLTWAAGGSTVTADIFTLPSSWTTKADAGSNKGGLAGVFFLALTLVLVSFSCTGPIVGTVLIKSTQGEFWTPMVTMLAFSVAFALPFALLAFFPSILKKLPKSGGWLNSVKVVLGFVEIALGLKFLSTADQTYHWHLLDREVYLAIWIVVFSLLGLYLLGKIRFKHDTPLEHLSVGRLALVIADFAFVVYMIPGMWGAPLKALSGYLPPIQTQDFVLSVGAAQPAVVLEDVPAAPSQVSLPHGLTGYSDLQDGLAVAAATGKKVFIDITGHGCVNCREMEARVWSAPSVLKQLSEDYVIVSLYVDDNGSTPSWSWTALG